jgi:predicted ester cyclase
MATTLTTDEMKAFLRRHFEEFVNARRAKVIRQNMTPDFVDHDGPGGNRAGMAEEERMMLGMYRMRPGIKVTIEDLVAEGDRVVCRNIWRWNDATTGYPMEFHGFVEWRFEGNKIAERWATVTDPRRVQVK